MDGLAAQVHTHARADGGDVVGAEHGNDLFERGEHLLARHDDLGVLGADEVGDFTGVLEVDGVKVHADGKGADFLAEELGGDGADKAGIQSAGEQEAERRVGVEPLFHARDELLTDLFAYGVQIVPGVFRHRGEVGVADEFAVGVVVARREGHDALAQTDEVLRLAGEEDAAVGEIAVEERADADGVARGDETVGLGVINDHGKLGIELGEHLHAVLAVEGENELAVGLGREGVALGLQLLFERTEAVQLAVANRHVAAEVEGLHPLLVQAHDGKTVEAEHTAAGLFRPAHVGTAGNGAVKVRTDLLLRQGGGIKTDDSAHKKHLQIK